MSIRKVLVLTSLMALLCAAPLWAQSDEQETEATYSLHRTTTAEQMAQEEAEEFEVWVPRIMPGELEASLTLGFLDLQTTLLSHDQIIYKYDREYTSWGDVTIQGESAFNPIVRLHYNVNSWFAIEPLFNLAVCEYQADVTNRRRRKNEENSPIEDDPDLGEFDAEHRSVITLGLGGNATIYPLNIKGSREARLHPFLSAGATKFWMSMNSNYTEDSSQSWMTSFGGGLRFIADELVSIRFEVMYNTTEIQFMANEAFDILDEGTLVIPVLEYPEDDAGVVDENRVIEYEAKTISSLSWAVGFVANF